MNRFWKIFILIPVLFLMANILQAQAVTVTEDSLSVRVQQDKETNTQAGDDESKRGKISDENNNTSSGQEEKATGVKRVRGARPDMSKARGARPPQVTRQSGSGIPKGMGRPGGARGPGRR